MTHRLVLAATLVLSFYLVLTIPLALWGPATDLSGVVGFGLYTLLALGLAADVTELLLALAWPAASLHYSRAASF